MNIIKIHESVFPIKKSLDSCSEQDDFSRMASAENYNKQIYSVENH